MNESRRPAVAQPGQSTPPSDASAQPAARTWRAREVALVVLAVLATVAAAKVTAPLLIPVVLAILGSYALRPIVQALERLRIPRAAGAFLVITAIVAALGGTAWALADDVTAAVAELPDAARKLRATVQRWQSSGPGPISHVQEAAKELDKTAAEVGGRTGPPGRAPASPTEPAGPSLSKQLAENAAPVFGVVGQLAIAGLLTGLMLGAGDTFRRKLLRIMGTSLAKRRITVQILDEINAQVQRQLLILVGANLLIALILWPLFEVLGLTRAPLWATLVGLLHFIPYVGMAIATISVGVVALLQFGTAASMLGFAGVTASVAFAIGFGLMGWWQGRAVSMNAVATFIALLFFGWLWGPWGLILGGPVMAVFKVFADRIESLKPLGELLGD